MSSRGSRGPISEDDDDRHRFNKYSKNDGYRGHRREESHGKGRYEDREDGNRRGDFRGKGRDDYRGKGEHRGKGGNRDKGDYHAKGNDRAARQEARRRFFGNDEE